MNKAITVIKTTLILFLITSAAALLLAFVNDKTAPLIAENAGAKQQAALKTVMPSAAKFEQTQADEKITAAAAENGCEINGIYIAKNESGNDCGICTIITGSGYDSGLQLAVGVDRDLKVTAIEIISSNETPGLGQKASNDDFKKQFEGKSGSLSVVKSGASDSQINAISGATLTSNGVAKIVNTALKAAEIKEGK